jgi:photosystem II stability/assembly factor-like uncharacterized protein
MRRESSITAQQGRVLAFLLFWVVLSQTDQGFSQWKRLIRFDSSRMLDIYFVRDSCDKEEGFISSRSITGSNISVSLRTTDKGATWQTMNGLPDGTQVFAFENLNKGWCSPYGGDPIFETSDAGLTWTSLKYANRTRFLDIKYNRFTNLLFATDNYYYYSSPDLGVTWRVLGNSQQIGVVFSNAKVGIMSGAINYASLYTQDGGNTWLRSSLLGDDWQPLAISGTTTFFCLCELGGQEQNKLYRSDDGGKTWRFIYAFSLSETVSGTVIGDLCHLYVQTSNGVLESHDQGVSWTSIGGPAAGADLRMQMSGGSLYAADFWQLTSDGSTSLWRYDLPNPQVILDPPAVLLLRCGVVDTTIRFSIDGICGHEILSSAEIQGSSAFSILSRPVLPDSLSDSLLIGYSPISPGIDTAHLLLSFCTPRGTIDTSIALYGSGIQSQRIDFLGKLKRSVAKRSDAISLDVTPDRKLSGVGLNSIDVRVTFDRNVLTLTGNQSQLAGSAVAMGTPVVIGRSASIVFRVSGADLALDPSQSILRCSFSVSNVDTNAISFELDSLLLNRGDAHYASCILRAMIDSTPLHLTLECKPILGIDSSIIFTTCNVIDSTFQFHFTTDCLTGQLKNLKLSGSPSFRLVYIPKVPLSLPSQDSIVLRYSPSTLLPDTSLLSFQFRTPTGATDTSITLYGSGRGNGAQVQLKPVIAQQTGHAGDKLSLKIFSSASVQNASLNQLTCNLSYNGDLLSASGFQTGVAGASISVGAVRRVGKTESVPITISGVNLTLDPNVPIVTAQMRALLTDSTSTAIEVSDPVLNGGDVNYRCTLGMAGDSTTFRMIDLCGDPTIRQFLSTKTLTINGVEPNPSTSHITIDIRNAFGNVRLEVYDLMGKLVHSQSAVEGKNGVDVAGLSVGSYVLRISDEKNVVSRMVVKLSEP